MPSRRSKPRSIRRSKKSSIRSKKSSPRKICRVNCRSNCKKSGSTRKQCKSKCKSKCKSLKGSRRRSNWRQKKYLEQDKKNRAICKSKGRIFHLTYNGYKCMTKREVSKSRNQEADHIRRHNRGY